MKELAFLCYLEFCTMYRRVKKPMTQHSKKGRMCNLELEFQPDHPLYETHYLKLLSFHCTPVLAGAPRPPFSHYRQRKTRTSFVKYYSALFVPWGENHEFEVNAQMTAKEFCKLMHEWSSPDASAILRARCVHLPTPCHLPSRLSLVTCMA